MVNREANFCVAYKIGNAHKIPVDRQREDRNGGVGSVSVNYFTSIRQKLKSYCNSQSFIKAL